MTTKGQRLTTARQESAPLLPVPLFTVTQFLDDPVDRLGAGVNKAFVI